jgi:serine protease Do
VQFKIQWKPRSEFYIASLDAGFNLSNCVVLNAEKQAGLEEYKLHFKKLRIGRPGNLVFTHEGQFAGFLTTVARRLSPMRNFFVNLLPVDQIIPSVQRIIRTRSNIKGGWLGVYLKDQPQQPRLVTAGEVTVTDVVPGGPADKAGIMENDRILKVNDVATEDLSQVVRMIQKSPAGSTVKMELARGDKILQVRSKVGNREAFEGQATYLIEVPPQDYNTIRVRRADESLMKRYDALFVGIYISDTLQPAKIQGLIVTDVVGNTPAARAGLLKGDVIVQINGMPVRNMDQYTTALAALVNNPTAHAITLRCLRDKKEIQKTISLK